MMENGITIEQMEKENFGSLQVTFLKDIGEMTKEKGKVGSGILIGVYMLGSGKVIMFMVKENILIGIGKKEKVNGLMVNLWMVNLKKLNHRKINLKKLNQ